MVDLDNSIKILLEALESDEPEIEAAALALITEMGLATFIDPSNVTRVQLNLAIFQALVKIGKPVIEPLIKALDSEVIRVRYYASWALGSIGDVQAVMPLVELLDDFEDDVRYMAAESLGRLGDSRALDRLERIANDDRRQAGDQLRKVAREAVQQIRYANE